MSIKCLCCREEIEGAKCNRCNFINAEVLDEEGKKFMEEKLSKHRADIEASLTDFSIISFIYEENLSIKKLEEKGSTTIHLADAKDCYLKEWWSNPMFEQNASDKNRTLNLVYSINGEHVPLFVNIKPVKTEGLMKMGLYIDEEYYLTVMIGDENNYAKTERIKLVLI